MAAETSINSIVVPARMPALVRAIGGRWKDGRRSYRMKWGELSFGKRGSAFDLCMFSADDGGGRFSLHLHALWVSAFISLPFLNRWAFAPGEMMVSWGYSHAPDMGLHLHWGERKLSSFPHRQQRTKIVTMPWRDWMQTAHDVRRSDGTWAPYVGSWERDKEPDDRHKATYPYRYVLRSGEVQDRNATIYVERRVRKLKWLRWLPWGRTSYAISVDFDGEVGERAGSWKGGCTGCSYELRKDETPLECLRRMLRDRRFD